jgi:hypothetical protein
MADTPNNITKLLTALVTPHQSVEDTLQQLRTNRWIDSAEGAQLDLLGKIVGQLRNGLDDDDYRRYLRARISANISDGLVEDLIRVAVLIIDDDSITIEIDQQGMAAVVVRLSGALEATTAEILIKFLKLSVAGGVRVILEWSAVAPSGWFVWDTGPGWDDGAFLDAVS